MKPVFVIVPVFNESAVIRQTLEGLLAYGYTVVVVDDGSEQNIKEALGGLPVSLLRHRFNMGQGAAIQTGISYALKKGAEIFVTFDADGQHNAADIAPMIELLYKENAAIVFGSRFMSIAPAEITFARKVVLQAARFLNYIFSGILLSDAHNGLRAFNRNTAASFQILENRMAHATEILIHVRRKKFKYTEFPVHISYTPYSRKKGQKFSHSFKILQDIILHKIFK